ncbi:MAG TPA: META domain-containing protein [Burkholderiales bacterium]|jgi:para-nitrobenzyl esterase
MRVLLAFLLLAGCARIAPTPETLAGTAWRLVKFQGGDDKVLAPDDRSKYTLAFNADGRVAARLDCNRGTGSWKSAGPGQLELGPMAVTRAMCAPGSIDHEISKRLFYVRSYVLKNGRLFLSMMADGGVFELEPLP